VARHRDEQGNAEHHDYYEAYDPPEEDNWADYFPDDYPEKLVEGLTVGEGGIDRDDSIVTRLLAWVARASGRSKDTRYEMTRHD
jgi:hypothetical protein